MKTSQPNLLEEINQILAIDPTACEFVKAYNDYVHAVDDVVDEDEPSLVERVSKATRLAAKCYSTDFWRNHCDRLYLVEQLIANDYLDSEEWRSSDKYWKQTHGEALSHAGYKMFFAVVLLVAGFDSLRKISSSFRTHSHEKHLSTLEKSHEVSPSK